MHRIVFQSIDGKLRINVPNPKGKWFFESGEAFAARMVDEATQRDPSLASLPYELMDEVDVPSGHQGRDKWRIKLRGGKKVVEIDNTVS